MGRRLRCLLADRLVEVTCRTVQGRFLLRPSARANLIIKGTLGRAQRYTHMKLVACSFLSNHYHLLVVPESEKQLADFMRFLNTNLSKQLARLHGWSGPLFHRRYQAIPVTDSEEAQVDRLLYLLEQGVKENLVESPGDWPGVQCVQELEGGTRELWGLWEERTRIWNARQAGLRLNPRQRVTRETVRLSPLPTWAERSANERRRLVRDLLEGIRKAARAARGSAKRVLGAKAILAQDPHDRPKSSKQSPAPLVHAASVVEWLDHKIAYYAFVKAYRQAAILARAGVEAVFPGGCFLPTGAYLARAGPGG